MFKYHFRTFQRWYGETDNFIVYKEHNILFLTILHLRSAIPEHHLKVRNAWK